MRRVKMWWDEGGARGPTGADEFDCDTVLAHWYWCCLCGANSGETKFLGWAGDTQAMMQCHDGALAHALTHTEAT